MTAIPFGSYEATSDVSERRHYRDRGETIHSLEVPRAWLSDLALEEGHSWITRFTNELQRLGQLPRDWNSYGAEAPSRSALAAGAAVLEHLWALGAKPTRIGPLADGGVFITLVASRGRFDADCFNSGETVLKVRRAGEPAQTGETYGDARRTRGDVARALREIEAGSTAADASTREDTRASI